VHLVERTAHIGGTSIKFEDVFPNLECATCMLAPLEQELLQDPNVHLSTLTEITGLGGGPGNFLARLRRKARYVDLENCIGCGACYEACPVSSSNEFEEGMSQRKAIYIPCAGVLPNVPRIDTELCLRFKEQECTACQEACVFEAVDFAQQDQELELRVGAVLVAVGSGVMDLREVPQYSYGAHPGVFTALELERLFASNGPTEGTVQLRDGRSPARIALVHCVGRRERNMCSGVCCRYLLKFRHYLQVKLPEAEVLEFHGDLCLPNKGDQRFMEEMAPDGHGMLRAEVTCIEGAGDQLKVSFRSSKGAGTERVELTQDGYFASEGVLSSRPGVFVIGGAGGPKDIRETVIEALAACGEAMRCMDGGGRA
jgi:heterodisulfide reductase subunit A